MQKFSELIKKSTEDGAGKKKDRQFRKDGSRLQNPMMIRCLRLDGRTYHYR